METTTCIFTTRYQTTSVSEQAHFIENKIMKLLSILFLLGFSYQLHAQQNISVSAGSNNQTFNTCNGFILDSGGQGGPGYSNNEDVTFTVCPDTPGDFISVVFNLFSLSTVDDNPSPTVTNVDRMYVYDGTSTAANFLGVYEGNQLQTVVIQASPQNLTGCLTFRFVSNISGTGMFSASATCETPCSDPVAAGQLTGGITSDSIHVCIGQPVNFQNLGSFAQPGFSLASYSWDFMDGETATGTNVSHAFDIPGHYRVQLFVTDDNGCTNNNLIDLQVLVATKPSFVGFLGDTTLCIGESLNAYAQPELYEVIWDGFTGYETIDDGCLPDTLLGVAQQIDILQTGFAAGTTITNASQIQEICVELEHSFMGDIVVYLTCPNGQSIMLHQQGGGGTQLGIPVQEDNVSCSDPTTNGVPFNYCFSASATETWVEWVNNNGGFGQTLPAGTYEPIQPVSNLVGCPTNGVWTLTVVDNWAADDGTLFSFGLTLDPSLYPDLVTFQPQIGTGADSSYWTYPAIFASNLSPGKDSMVITPTYGGQFTYTYNVIDNFGCTNDTSIVVTVNENAIPFAGNDTLICPNSPLHLKAVVVGGTQGLTFNWTPAADLNNSHVPNPIATIDTDQTFTVTMYPTGHPLCATTDNIHVTLIDAAYAGHDSSLTVCSSGAPVNLFPFVGPGVNPTGYWLNPAGNLVTMPYVPITMNPGVYKYALDSNGCTTNSKITVIELVTEITNIAPVNVSCNSAANGSATITAVNFVSYSVNGGPQTVATSPFTLSNLAPGSYTVDILSSIGCTDQETFTITEPAPLALAFVSNDTTICFGATITIAALGNGGSSPYTYSWTENGTPFQQGASIIVTPPLDSNTYCVTLSEACGSPITSACMTIDNPEVITPVIVPDRVDGCFPVDVNFANTTNSTEIGTTYIDFGDGQNATAPGNATVVHSYQHAGIYTVFVRITSIYGCIYETTYPALIEAYSYPEASFLIQSNPASIFEPVVQLVNKSSDDAIIYEWVMPTGTPATSANPNVEVTYPTDIVSLYPVTLTVENEDGCRDSLTLQVSIISDVLLYVPNAFTPDDNEFNQTWKIFMSGVDPYNFNLKVFNRWGEVVWESKDATEGWDGTYGGKLVPAGVYSWIIEAKDQTTDAKYTYNGFVNVMH
jgi:gliding motility-associated-like protein